MDKETIESAAAYSKDYMENLLNFFGLNLRIETEIDGPVIQLNVPSNRLNRLLIGAGAETLNAWQNIVMVALSSQGYRYCRVNLDIAGYKQQRLARLTTKAQAWVKEVQRTQSSKQLEPMNPAERRAIHQLAATAGLTTKSVGYGRQRAVVLYPDDSAPDPQSTDAD